jgi:tRNA pseudouridine55 synthase
MAKIGAVARRAPRRPDHLDGPCRDTVLFSILAEEWPIHGWLIIDKPVGPGSTQVVSAVKRALRDGGYPKLKVGHGGTLDPLASGVLPVALGEATKLCGPECWMRTRFYDFTIGSERDEHAGCGGGGGGNSDVRPSLRGGGGAAAFTGVIEQVPPAYPR